MEHPSLTVKPAKINEKILAFLEDDKQLAEFTAKVEEAQARSERLVEMLPAVISRLEQVDALEQRVLELVAQYLDKEKKV